MSDATSVLFGLEDEFVVVEVQRIDASRVKVLIEQLVREAPCPECGVFTAAVKDRPVMRLKDLPASGQAVELWWRKRRLICVEPLCPRKSFTQTSTAVRPRGRVTERLRDRVATAIASSNRAVSDVAAEYTVSWRTAHKALVAAAARWLPEPSPTSRLGIDETRFRSIRWVLDGITWKRSDPWLSRLWTAPVTGRDRCWGWLLGAPGRVCGAGWASSPQRFGKPLRLW